MEITAALFDEAPKALNCLKCGGSGRIRKKLHTPGDPIDAKVTCPECNGSGRYQYRGERT